MDAVIEKPLIDRLKATARKDKTDNGSLLMKKLNYIIMRMVSNSYKGIPVKTIIEIAKEESLEAERIYLANQKLFDKK